ncbi:MAG: hypothetical protein K2W95_32385, partial [Candidatus Obscuribacterales bacterium]|nr:hypothetical protein [Candidatus Obscuribacterales bacterium]
PPVVNPGNPGGNRPPVVNPGNPGGNRPPVVNPGNPGGNRPPVVNPGNPGGNRPPVVNPDNPGGNRPPVVNPGNPGGNRPPVVNPDKPGGSRPPVINPGNPGSNRPPVVNPGNPGGNKPERPHVPVTVPVHNPRPGHANHPHNPVTVQPPRVPNGVKPHNVHCVPGTAPHNHHLMRPPVHQQNFCAPVNDVYRGRYVAPMRNCNYNRGYWYGGTCYNSNPFWTAANWCPTAYIYYGNNCWFRPGYGYYYSPPVAYVDTITVVVEETYTEWERNPITGQLELVPRTVTWYYNAYYYANTGFHGYTDCHGKFHWVRW